MISSLALIVSHIEGKGIDQPSISDAPHKLEIDWKAATASGANNGVMMQTGWYITTA